MSIMPDTLSLTAGAASSWLRRSPRSPDLNPGIPVPSPQLEVRIQSSVISGKNEAKKKTQHVPLSLRVESSRSNLQIAASLSAQLGLGLGLGMGLGLGLGKLGSVFGYDTRS